MEKNELICARLRVSFDRGTRRNSADDLGLAERPTETENGGLVRGLGSHWRSADAKESAKALAAVEGRIRREFSAAFPPSPIPGIYVLTGRGAGKALVETIDVPAEVAVHVTEFSMGMFDVLPPAELAEWSERVKRQVELVSLGRKKWADEQGLEALRRLAECPIFTATTKDEILSLIRDASPGVKAIDRIEIKRFLGELDVSVNVPDVAPRRVRVDATPADAATETPVRPRRVPVDLGADDADATPAENVA